MTDASPGRDVLAAVRSAFPELAWNRADYPEQGLDHHVAILSGVSGLAVPDSDPVSVPRSGTRSDTTTAPATIVARLATAPGVVGRADIEARVLRTIDATAPARLPQPIATDGGSLTLSAHVPGVPLSDAVWASLDDGARATVADALVGTLDAVHALTVDDPAVDDVGESWFPVKHAKLAAAVDEHLLPQLDSRDVGAVRDIFREAGDVFIDDPARARLIHGDLHETHIRWHGDDPSGELGVIDFSDMTLADPAIDVAHLTGISPELHGRVVSGLASADDDLAARAAVYSRWDAVFLMADHVTTGRTPETTARALFGRALEVMRGR